MVFSVNNISINMILTIQVETKSDHSTLEYFLFC